MDLQRLLMAVVGLMLLGGCAWFKERPELARISIRVAVQEVILRSANPVRLRARIIDVGHRVLLFLDEDGAPVTLVYLQQRAEEEIDWPALDPADQLLVRSLIRAIVEDLARHVTAGVLDPEDLITIRQVVVWVVEAASFARTEATRYAA